MTAFDSVADFPADHVSAALLVDGDVRTLGDTSRVYSIASVTKPVVAYGIMLAVEEGVVELDQPAGPSGSTLRHLLAHASGVGFDTREAQKPVGERRIYSSAGYEWAADIVAEATGMEFPEYVREGVFEPLGMKDSALVGSAGHGLDSTVDDMVRFAREVLDPQLLHPTTVEEMLTPQFPSLRGLVPGYGSFKDCSWGLGFELHGDKDHWMGSLPAETAGHFGMSGTYLWLAEGKAMVMLTDHDFGDWPKPLWAETNSAIWSELQS